MVVTSNVIRFGSRTFSEIRTDLISLIKQSYPEVLSDFTDSSVGAMLIDLNDNEKEGIKRFSQGEALFVCGNRRMQINVIVTEDELESFGSGGGL